MGPHWESDIRAETLGKWILGKAFEAEEQDVQCPCSAWSGKSRETKQSHGQGENGRSALIDLYFARVILAAIL